MKKLTTHVLDTANGIPGKGIKIDLYNVSHERIHIKTVTTNDDGRVDSPLLEGDAFEYGTWELVFHVAAYFQNKTTDSNKNAVSKQSQRTPPPFLDEIPLRFGISTDEHYHVPLLVSPWSYSTYRGS